MKNYNFYGYKGELEPISEKYKAITSTTKLYDLLSGIWCERSCAPRLRERWSEQNKTVGQCSVTAFLTQDIFGGKVYGIPLESGGVHCYNEINGKVFDLTNEQFGDTELVYDKTNEQSRNKHFEDKEKFARYKYLTERLEEALRS